MYVMVARSVLHAMGQDGILVIHVISQENANIAMAQEKKTVMIAMETVGFGMIAVRVTERGDIPFVMDMMLIVVCAMAPVIIIKRIAGRVMVQGWLIVIFVMVADVVKNAVVKDQSNAMLVMELGLAESVEGKVFLNVVIVRGPAYVRLAKVVNLSLVADV